MMGTNSKPQMAVKDEKKRDSANTAERCSTVLDQVLTVALRYSRSAIHFNRGPNHEK